MDTKNAAAFGIDLSDEELSSVSGGKEAMTQATLVKQDIYSITVNRPASYESFAITVNRPAAYRS